MTTKIMHSNRSVGGGDVGVTNEINGGGWGFIDMALSYNLHISLA